MEANDKNATPTPSTEAPELDPALKRKTRVAIFKYGVARFLLFVALTALIHIAAVLLNAPVPIIMSALLALIVAFPLSMLIFTKWRLEATNSVAELSRQRKARKEWIQSELSGR